MIKLDKCKMARKRFFLIEINSRLRLLFIYLYLHVHVFMLNYLHVCINIYVYNPDYSPNISKDESNDIKSKYNYPILTLFR